MGRQKFPLSDMLKRRRGGRHGRDAKANVQLCHLFDKPELTQDDLDFDTVETYQESEHFDRKLVRCGVCGALFVYEFYEINNFTTGEDKMYSSYIAVADAARARELAEMGSFRHLRPAIFWDPFGRVYAIAE